MWLKPDRNTTANLKGIRVGIIVTCENGEFRGGRGGGYVVGPDGKSKIAKFPGDAGVGHAQNFTDAIRSRRAEDLRSPIDQAAQSAALSHLANISLRCGDSLPLDKLKPSTPNNPDLHEIIDRQQSQLRDWNVDLATTPCTLGALVTTDPQTATILNPDRAVKLYHPEYRKEFTVPEIS
jgi:hypothetical protein